MVIPPTKADERARKKREKRANRTPIQKANDAAKRKARRKELTLEQKAKKAKKSVRGELRGQPSRK